MNEINKLPADISNKIAAGEVAENPMHVVKELVENALDSGATVIHIAIQSGGLQSIIIRDNGMGILPEDMPHTVERFCTSKVKDYYDPTQIKTMGFRGEALAAISSVSEFEIHSMRSGYDAKRLTINSSTNSNTNSNTNSAGQAVVTDAEPISGTRVIVRNLFYNVPARRKFLKSSGHYTREITRFVKLFATVNLAMEVTLTSDAKEVFTMKQHLPFKARAAHMLGVSSLISAEIDADETTVCLVATDPTIQKPRRNGIMFAINGRVVNDPYLTNAITQAYHRLMPANTYPMAVVSIIVDSSEVDVNVHPNKLEVKLLNQRNVFSLVHRCVLKALSTVAMENVAHGGHHGGHHGEHHGEHHGGHHGEHHGNIQEQRNRSLYPSKNYYANSDELYLKGKKYKGEAQGSTTAVTIDPQSGNSSGYYSYQHGRSTSIPRSPQAHNPESSSPLPESSLPESSLPESSLPESSLPESSLPESSLPRGMAGEINSSTVHNGNNTTEATSPLTALAQLDNTFILCANQHNDLVLVDQHIAHERVLYEKLQLEQTTHKPTIHLHTPVSMDVSQEENDALVANSSYLREQGFQVEHNDDSQSIRILQVPMEVSKSDVAQSVRKILHELAADTPVSRLDKTSMSLSCRKAIKAGDALELLEMQDLLHQLSQTSNPLTCPHGRPIMVRISLDKVKSMFGR